MKNWFVCAVWVGLAAVAARVQTPAELKVGDKAPEFSLPGTDGKTHRLSDYKGRTVVLAWYPAAFTGGCTAECKSFTSSGEAIKKFDVVYFMASVDDEAKNKDFAAQEQANFPMLSDPDRKAAMAYGVVTSPTARAQRWTFYIGPDGKIQYIEKKVNVQTAGADLAAKLAELNVKQK
jgi:peroxiredoxin Q/BCP